MKCTKKKKKRRYKNKKQTEKINKQKIITCRVQQLLLCLACLGLCFHRDNWSGLKSLGGVHWRNETRPEIGYL